MSRVTGRRDGPRTSMLTEQGRTPRGSGRRHPRGLQSPPQHKHARSGSANGNRNDLAGGEPGEARKIGMGVY